MFLERCDVLGQFTKSEKTHIVQPKKASFTKTEETQIAQPKKTPHLEKLKNTHIAQPKASLIYRS